MERVAVAAARETLLFLFFLTRILFSFLPIIILSCCDRRSLLLRPSFSAAQAVVLCRSGRRSLGPQHVRLAPQELSAAVKGNMDDTSRSILEIGIMDLDKLTTAADTLIRSPVPLFYTQVRLYVLSDYLITFRSTPPRSNQVLHGAGCKGPRDAKRFQRSRSTWRDS